jgi:hypothetical protein
MPRNTPQEPTTCNISDLLNKIASFIDSVPLWMEDPQNVERMMLAYSILRNISSPEMVTDEEYEFVMDIHTKIKEMSDQ